MKVQHVPAEWVDEAPTMVSEAKDQKIDPKLIAAVLVIESGGVKYPKGSHNPFGLLGKRYESDDDAIHAVAQTLGHHIYRDGQDSVSALYSGKGGVYSGRWHENVVQAPAYCAHPSCSASNAERVYKLTGGNPNELKSP